MALNPSLGHGFRLGRSAHQKNNARGEARDEVLSADRPQFSHGEKSGGGDRPKLLVDRLDIVVRLNEESSTRPLQVNTKLPAAGPSIRAKANKCRRSCRRFRRRECGIARSG